MIQREAGVRDHVGAQCRHLRLGGGVELGHRLLGRDGLRETIDRRCSESRPGSGAVSGADGAGVAWKIWKTQQQQPQQRRM